MSSIVSYQLTSSDESSSDESENTEFVQLPSKKFCPDQEESNFTSNAEGDDQEDDDQEEEEEKEIEVEVVEVVDAVEEEKEEEEEEEEEELQLQSSEPGEEEDPNDLLDVHEIQADLNRPVRKKSYALDKKELPGEMKKFLQEVKRFFTRPVNLERQAKALADSTYRKTQERILCELFRKFRENSFDDLIIVVFIYVLNRPFSCLQVSWDL